MLYLLSESHLAVHTYPEHALATFDFVCCREDVDWPWDAELRAGLGARDVHVRRLPRGVWPPGQTGATRRVAESAEGLR
ncbi:S-adenosylmethionine decarboxylase proenzyme precursor [Allorhodopirellula solitaria]|uniref:S-adenosylmethionine decarboxylase proenzyme n=2 Tax=Allorhodopirellula solitaria TaxID=2527987 RepID=A0A5C5WNL2_9BACT|nr:S-adenosylmethionine decarboxylase proenzyme precursor [Allorhodopirellula solitaria]